MSLMEGGTILFFLFLESLHWKMYINFFHFQELSDEDFPCMENEPNKGKGKRKRERERQREKERQGKGKGKGEAEGERKTKKRHMQKMCGRGNSCNLKVM